MVVFFFFLRARSMARLPWMENTESLRVDGRFDDFDRDFTL